jgi:predicted nucleic acid-binding protein
LKAVLDASTIISLVKKHGEDSIDMLEGSATIALAPYEIGNMLCTETQLTRTLTVAETDRLLYIFYRILAVVTVAAPATADEAIRILRMARETDTSYYDVAYLTEAKKKRVPLATEDRRLAEAAERNGVKTFNADSLSS